MSIEAIVLLGVIVGGIVAAVGAAAGWMWATLRKVEPRAYSEMENAMAEMTRQQAEIRAQQAVDHLAMRQMAMQITRLEIGVIKLSEQVKQLGGVPVFTADPAPTTTPPIPDDGTLAVALATLFNDEELTLLADELSVPDGQLAGDTTQARARSLVKYMRRRKRMNDLVTLARQRRPDGGF